MSVTGETHFAVVLSIGSFARTKAERRCTRVAVYLSLTSLVHTHAHTHTPLDASLLTHLQRAVHVTRARPRGDERRERDGVGGDAPLHAVLQHLAGRLRDAGGRDISPLGFGLGLGQV